MAQRDYEYVRKGSANLFYSVEPLAGRHRVEATPNRTAARTARALKHVADAYPRARTIHLVWDNLNTHCEKTLTDTFGQKEGHALWCRFTVHYTPRRDMLRSKD
ncbi:transposase [Myxococcus sp. AM009]|nr:transposase [Myxococcus sp. AM009]